jgi:hypothetical protein
MASRRTPNQTPAVTTALRMVGFTETARGMRLGGCEIPKRELKTFDTAAKAVGGAAFRSSNKELRRALAETGVALAECHSLFLH